MKRIRLLFLAFFVFLLCGCRKQTPDFSEFSHQMVHDILEPDTLSQAYFLKNPAAYGLTSKDASFATWNPRELSQKNDLIAYQKTTRHFLSSGTLSDKETFLAECLDRWLTGQIIGKRYYLYEEPFDTTSGIQVELPILLSEYPMDETKDAELYLELLSKTDDYLKSALLFEKEKAKNGLFMSKEQLAICLEQIDTLIHHSYDWLTESFSRKLSELPLSKEERLRFLTGQAAALTNKFYPALESARLELLALRDFEANDKGLCYFPEGKAYYEHLIENMVGSDKTPLSCKIRIQQELISCFSRLAQAKTDELSTKITEYSLFSVDYSKIIHALKTAILQDFPSISDISCEIFQVPASMSEIVSPAFYLTARIDDPYENVIYINPEEDTDYIRTFQTLAHEGYPGHLYQNVSFAGGQPKPLQALIGCTGYAEGWATYAEMYSFRYLAKDDTELASYLADSYSASLAIYSLCDIGVHYEGWDVEQLENFLLVYFSGVTKNQTEDLYRQILGSPANYLNYYMGYLEILDIKEEFRQLFPDKTEREFHESFLALGPAPFSLLKKTLLSSP